MAQRHDLSRSWRRIRSCRPGRIDQRQVFFRAPDDEGRTTDNARATHTTSPTRRDEEISFGTAESGRPGAPRRRRQWSTPANAEASCFGARAPRGSPQPQRQRRVALLSRAAPRTVAMPTTFRCDAVAHRPATARGESHSRAVPSRSLLVMKEFMRRKRGRQHRCVRSRWR